MDNFCIPTRRGDCGEFPAEVLLPFRNETVPDGCFFLHAAIVDSDDSSRVKLKTLLHLRQLSMPFPDRRNIFEILITARLMGGFGSGIIFILVPIYMKELRGEQHNNRIVDLLITLFGFGIFIQYFIGELHLFRVFIMAGGFMAFER
jgi:MFS family permease